MQNPLQTFKSQLRRFRSRVDDCKPAALQNPIWDTYERAALAVLLSGALERFLREVVEEYIEHVCATVQRFDDLPEVMRRHHYKGGADQLCEAVRLETRRAAGRTPVPYSAALEVCRKLASSGAEKYALVWEAFADTQANPGPDTVKDILRRLDVRKPWETLEARIPSDPHPGLRKGGALGNKLNADLRELLSARNRCAHGMAETAAPAYSSIEDYLVSLEAIADGIVGALEQRLETLVSPAPVS